jgi:two-component system nitrogen regulation response regulator NtrX
MISGHGTIETAVKATRLGAYDFVEKPLSLEKILVTVSRALEHARLERERCARAGFEQRAEIVGERGGSGSCVSRSRPPRPPPAAFSSTARTAAARSWWRAIHVQSARRERSFVEVNCAAIPEELIESELFGHEKARSPGRWRVAAESSSSPTAARSSSTRSAT